MYEPKNMTVSDPWGDLYRLFVKSSHESNQATPVLLGHMDLLCHFFVRTPKSYMISVYQILQHPLGSIQLEESDFKVVPEADF